MATGAWKRRRGAEAGELFTGTEVAPVEEITD